ncbi:hypothetical protein GCM10011583_18560 [Streptomyces camponoticapitis]|uniref:Uncharacterized protein n=1 Tax=Streptomyces camponoticapitis TaxID=1616125 RepID=A0ABQ2E1I7_9ACTN|nr:hypothetical protein [Streptomyces camponoticapitis]GGJ87300.1 hypothetical protein GCM10011583_18560 [Streptomyces camponoticapitis]
MTLLSTETAVMSELLCDLPSTPASVASPIATAMVRAVMRPEPVETDYEKSERKGFTETLDQWCERVLGRPS